VSGRACEEIKTGNHLDAHMRLLTRSLQTTKRNSQEFLDRRLCYCDDNSRIDALRFCEEIRQDLEHRALENPVAQNRLNTLQISKASEKFSSDFRMRCWFSLRRLSFNGRYPVSKEQQDAFVLRMQTLAEMPCDRIINIDKRT
jgi:hypothetical protein